VKTKLEFEIEVPDGATHYAGNPFNNTNGLAYYKCVQDGALGDRWWHWMEPERSWFLVSQGCRPGWLRELSKSSPPAIPSPNDARARDLIESKLAEYNWPANSMNAARAGWEACRDYAVETGLAVRQMAPSILDELNSVRAERSKDHPLRRAPGADWHPV
jgi:hypothetical protein